MLFRGTIFSKTLEMATGLVVAGPGNLSKAPTQVCYLLHGLCGNSGCWADYTRLRLYAEERRTLFIMPEAARSFYTDMRYGGLFLQYVAEELPEICANLFRIPTGRENTAVFGGSMGGYGAFKVALNHPERFGACAALSPCCLMIGEEMDDLRQTPAEQAEQTWGSTLMRDFHAIFGPELALCPQDNPVRLAERAARGNAPRLYLACGRQDEYLDDCRHYHGILTALDVPHTYEEWDGAHDWYFFDEALRRALIWMEQEGEG
ncbi:MAG: prolyl oligopeptidase family serine peptidase [Butyricicoccus pullicaecorum]|nr:prolyl oligopeptidase family serine peptidase [Butyricicoccus pullicaecorum]